MSASSCAEGRPERSEVSLSRKYATQKTRFLCSFSSALTAEWLHFLCSLIVCDSRIAADKSENEGCGLEVPRKNNAMPNNAWIDMRSTLYMVNSFVTARAFLR
jgi:hypothetical protein